MPLYVFGKKAPLAKELAEMKTAREEIEAVFVEPPSATKASMLETSTSKHMIVPESQHYPATPTRKAAVMSRESRERVRSVDCLISHSVPMALAKANLGLKDDDPSTPRLDKASTPDMLVELKTVDDNIRNELEFLNMPHSSSPSDLGTGDMRKCSMDDGLDWEIEATQLLLEPQSLRKRLVHLQESTPCFLELEPNARVVSSGPRIAETQQFNAPIDLDEAAKVASPQLTNIAKDTPIGDAGKSTKLNTASPKMSKVIGSSFDTSADGILPSSQDFPNPFLAVLAKSMMSPKSATKSKEAAAHSRAEADAIRDTIAEDQLEEQTVQVLQKSCLSGTPMPIKKAKKRPHKAIIPKSVFKTRADTASGKDIVEPWLPKTSNASPKAALLTGSVRISSRTKTTPKTFIAKPATRSNSRIEAAQHALKTAQRTPPRAANKMRMRVARGPLLSKKDEKTPASRKKQDARKAKQQAKEDSTMPIRIIDCPIPYSRHLLPDMLVWAPQGSPGVPAIYYCPVRLICNVSRRRELWKVRSLDHKKRAEGEYVKEDEAIVHADQLCPIGIGLVVGDAIYRRKRLEDVVLATFLAWTASVNAGEQLVRIQEAGGMVVTVKLKRLILDREAFLAKRTVWHSSPASTSSEVDRQQDKLLFTSTRFVLSRSTKNSWLEECKQRIVSNGGTILDCIPSGGLFTLVMHEFKRTAKFFQALALGAPIVGPHWLAACIQNKSLVSWTAYLPSGTPEIKAIGVPRTLLLGKTACIDSKIASEWTPIVSALGAQVDRESARTDKIDVAIDSESIEWLIECLFANRLY